MSCIIFPRKFFGAFLWGFGKPLVGFGDSWQLSLPLTPRFFFLGRSPWGQIVETRTLCRGPRIFFFTSGYLENLFYRGKLAFLVKPPLEFLLFTRVCGKPPFWGQVHNWVPKLGRHKDLPGGTPSIRRSILFLVGPHTKPHSVFFFGRLKKQ